MRAVTGETLVRMAAEATLHRLVGADDLEGEQAADAWHTFADLMRDVFDSAAELGERDRLALAAQVDDAIADLRHVRARVVAGSGGTVLFVAVLPTGLRRDARHLFAIT
jgi:hypothetical protein